MHSHSFSGVGDTGPAGFARRRYAPGQAGNPFFEGELNPVDIFNAFFGGNPFMNMGNPQ